MNIIRSVVLCARFDGIITIIIITQINNHLYCASCLVKLYFVSMGFDCQNESERTD